MRITDIRRGAMIAGEILIKRVALATASAPSGESDKPGAQKFRDARRRQSRRMKNDVQSLRRQSLSRSLGEIGIGHDTRSKNDMSAI
jgi:hypothetical protein